MKTKPLHLIVGLGPTGLAVAKYLSQLGRPFAAMDSRKQPPGSADFQRLYPNAICHLGGFDQALALQATQLVMSPGVSIQEPVIQAAIHAGIEVIGDIELFARAVKAPVIGITGSNGKSTVTQLLGEMLKTAGYHVLVGGNIGTQALALLEEPVPEVYVLELSSFQLETISHLALVSGVVTNITEDHLDRYHGQMSLYTKAKLRIFANCRVPVLPLYAAFNPLVLQHYPQEAELYFGLEAPKNNRTFGVIQYQAEDWLALGEKPIFPVKNMRLKAPHDIANALAALALGYAFGADLHKMVVRLAEFSGLDHRCQLVAEYLHIKWINDSKGTNVGATITAIESVAKTIDGKIVLIAGGQTKGANLSPLSQTIKHNVRSTLLIGEDAEKIADVLLDNYHYCQTMQEAIHQAAQIAKPGDAVLLSPAAASFDMFDNFSHRGDVFTEAVKAYVKGQS